MLCRGGRPCLGVGQGRARRVREASAGCVGTSLPRCPYLHRTTGDTERKYHLRYYKTGTCIHETDARGHCVRNGLHCAFAHGPLDLRPPVCDIRCVRRP